MRYKDVLSTPAPIADEKHTLEISIRSKFTPILRAEGFSGSGRTFRRVASGLAHIVQIQGSRYGGQFAVNLGIHPVCIGASIPTSGAARKLSVADCEFRRRLSVEDADQWWSYLTTPASMDAAVVEAAAVYLAVGRSAFAAMTGDASPIWTVTPEDFAEGRFNFQGFASTKVRMAYVLSLVRRARGDQNHAARFAQYALDLIGDGQGGAALRQELRVIAQDH